MVTVKHFALRKALVEWYKTEVFVSASLQVEEEMLSVYLEVDTVTTITSLTGQRKGNYSGVPPSASFPVPYSDDFDGILRVLIGCINYSAIFCVLVAL